MRHLLGLYCNLCTGFEDQLYHSTMAMVSVVGKVYLRCVSSSREMCLFCERFITAGSVRRIYKFGCEMYRIHLNNRAR